MDVSLKEIIQWVVIIPMGYLWHRVEALTRDMHNYYTKEETKEQITLRMQIMEAKIDNIQEDVQAIRKSLEDKD